MPLARSIQSNPFESPMDQLPSIQGRTLDTLSQGGDPFAIQRQGAEQAQGVASTANQSQIFGVALTDLLKQYQQLGTRPFQEQGLQAQEEQVRRLGQTPESLIGASPSLQAGVRGASAEALQPTIQGAQQSQRTFTEQIKGLGDTITAARGFLKDFEASEAQKRDDARTAINLALTTVGGDAFTNLDPTEVAQMEKIAGYPKGYVSGISRTIKERELALKQQQDQEKTQSGIVGEYQFYANQEQTAGRNPLSFNEYQNLDANRKRSIAQAGVANAQGLTPAQTTTFLRITDKFQADKIIENGNRGAGAITIADQVIKNPGSAGNQLKVLYTLVKSLDPDSAVREGELDLASRTQSYLGKFGTSLERIGQGKLISDAAAIELAKATKELAQIWYTAAKRKEKQYKSQAQVANIGGAFDQYLGGYERPYDSPAGQSGGSGIKQQISTARNKGWSDKEILKFLQGKGLVQVPKNQSVDPSQFLNSL